MFVDKNVELASQKPLSLENWNNFVATLKATYPDLPKSYEWMHVYSNIQPKKFLSALFADAVEHYAGQDPLKRIALSSLFLVGLTPSVIAKESITDILQHIVDIAS